MRCPASLSIVKILYQNTGSVTAKFLLYFFDPNNIRKVIPYRSRKCLRKVVTEYSDLWVDINDHIGFITWMNDYPFEDCMVFLGEIVSLTSDDFILDIGANIGTASVPACRKFGCSLIAIEPSRSNLQLLSQNISYNRIKAHIFPVALSSESSCEFFELYHPSGNEGSTSLLKNWNPGADCQFTSDFVPLSTLDSILLGENIPCDVIKLIKIDTEGYEEKVLRGASNFLSNTCAPLIFEYRLDAFSKYTSSDIGSIISYLSSFGFKFIALKNNTFVEFDMTKSYENVVAYKPQSLNLRLFGRY